MNEAKQQVRQSRRSTGRLPVSAQAGSVLYVLLLPLLQAVGLCYADDLDEFRVKREETVW